MALRGNTAIVLIQGQTFVYAIQFKSLVAQTIRRVIFSSKKLNVEGEFLQKTGTMANRFEYRMEASVTEKFAPCVTTFDVTVEFLDGTVEIETGIPIEVLTRQNPLSERR